MQQEGFVGRFDHHIFVCENVRPADSPRGCCATKGSPQVRAKFKEEVERRGLKGLVRANMAGCLDQCAHGVTVVIYPEQIWYGHVTVADVPEILDALSAGRVVERLRIADADLTGKAAPSPKVAPRSGA
jgi:(2Fe-2S) ferredoxin